MKQDVCREGVTPEKLLQLGRLFLPENNHAIVKVSKFNLIDLKRINEILGTNFKGAILDVDECMAPHHGNILPENTEATIRMIQDGIRVVIFSNMKASERYTPVIQTVKNRTGFEIEVILSCFAKPDPRGFQEAQEALRLGENEQTAMIGDNFVTDGGCIRAGIPFIKVDPIRTNESWGKKLKRSPQTKSRAFYSGISAFYDYIGNRQVLRDRDLV